MGLSYDDRRKIVSALERASASGCSSKCDSLLRSSDWGLAKTLETSRKRNNGTESISDLSSEWIQAESILKLTKAIVASASQLLNLYDHHLRPISLKLSKGLASLPDEILVYTLRFAQSEEASDMDALRFSHVSRRFRRLTVGNRLFWSTVNLTRCSDKECIDLLLSRGGKDARIHATFEFDRADWSLVKFLDTFSATAPLWASLSVKGKFYRKDRGRNVFDKLVELFEDRHLVLPQLQEMRIEGLHLQEVRGVSPFEGATEEDLYKYCWYPCETNFEGVRAWDLPSLRTIECIQCIPPPSFPLNNFTSLKMNIRVFSGHVSNQINGLKDFVASNPSITEVSLTLGGYAASGRVEHNFEIKPVVCPNVTSFKLSVTNFENHKFIDRLVDALQMPQLRDFKMSNEGYEGMGRTPRTPYLITPDMLNHRLLESFAIDIVEPRAGWAKKVPKILQLNLDGLPGVSSLSVTVSGGSTFWSSTERPLELNSLRELRFISCDLMDAKCLSDTVSSLKNIGAWETLERLVIQDCGLLVLERETVLKIVGEKRLRFVC
ncbi:hypothetical protein SCHPADRAFT_607147 [Schizopora paradoxa]|uniref:F-box domain-containing protein n=1 Tax=Schizopora paradoxa TaxID=27342 RepID=A0A0H2R9G1_9AGAM|nr:hypothetical protein SCHPADRAFT_607147 [Schizopora paradoxa]